MNHTRTMFWLFLQYIYASRRQKWLKFSLKSHAWHIEDFWDMSMLCSIVTHWSHIRAIILQFLQYLCFQMPEMAKIFTEESCMANRGIIYKFELFGPYYGHVLALFEPCFVHFYNFVASRCLKWLKFSLKHHACQRKEHSLMLSLGPYHGYLWAMIGPCFGYFYNIFACRCLK